MTTKQLLGQALMQLIGSAEMYDEVFWRESVVGGDVVNFHTQSERQAHAILNQALGQAQGALQAAARVAEKDTDDSLEIPD